MAHLIDHIHQATHNRICAQALLRNPIFRDWAITAAFYSAVHMAEAGFFLGPIQHTDKTCPRDRELHSYRQDMVRKEFGTEAFKRYKYLREASNNVRYLMKWNTETGTALDYYTVEDAKEFVENDLDTLKQIIEKKTHQSFDK